ncbi:MAG: hypothetical protein K0V04_08375 [Deltaproteobacteria bacterium]|nr:hypothetical protein [Deltaproteobacteria bacterium]
MPRSPYRQEAHVRLGPPIDDWGETAVDAATEFIPVVSKAIDRIQNGEDPMDVLANAAVDGATSITPGLKSYRKFANRRLAASRA